MCTKGTTVTNLYKERENISNIYPYIPFFVRVRERVGYGASW